MYGIVEISPVNIVIHSAVSTGEEVWWIRQLCVICKSSRASSTSSSLIVAPSSVFRAVEAPRAFGALGR